MTDRSGQQPQQPTPRADAVQTAITATQAYAHAQQTLTTAVKAALQAGATPDDLRTALQAKQARDRQTTQR